MIHEKLWCCANAIPVAQLPEQFRDNVYGQCCLCRREIMWRPHAMADAAKACMACAGVMATAIAKAGDPPLVVASKEGLAEATEILGEDQLREALLLAKKLFGGEEQD